MEAKELRAGNIVIWNFKEIALVAYNVYQIEIASNFDKARVKPIKLTEEWLLKLGFEHVVLLLEDCYRLELPNDEKHTYPFFFYSKSMGNLELLEAEHEHTITTVKYVHQLQNLYFALTGEELTIK